MSESTTTPPTTTPEPATNSTTPSKTGAAKSSSNSAKKTPTKKNSDIFNKLTDTKLYTGSHKHRFDENGQGRGIEGRTDKVESSDGYVEGFKPVQVSPSPDKNPKTPRVDVNYFLANHSIKDPNKASIFDKLTDPKLYTGAHKNRDGGKGESPTIKKSPSTTSVKKSTSSVKKSPSGSSIFDKLTDPKLYTGAHKHRFDDDGKGKGIEGRSDRKDLDGYVHGYKHKGTYEDEK